MDRSKKIIQTSIVGIVANVVLAASKAAVGLLTGSIAIVLDAVNNLSDALSSTVTVAGAKLAAKKPDKKHPFGYGRVEYISAMIIAVIVLYAGVTSIVESVKKIIEPALPEYTVIALAILGAAIAVKIFIGIYFNKVGKDCRSEALVNSGKDALFDSVISLSTVVAAIVFMWFGLSLEAYLGVVISLFIIKSGLEMLRDTLSEILGERVDSETAKAIKRTIEGFPEVSGAYDLFLHNYGPDTLIGSVHIEIPDTLTADKIDVLEHEIAKKVFAEHKVILAGISVYSHNTADEEVARVKNGVLSVVDANKYVMQMHGFYLNKEKKTVHFDVVIDFSAPDREAEYNSVLAAVREKFPEYSVTISLDSDVSD